MEKRIRMGAGVAGLTAAIYVAHTCVASLAIESMRPSGPFTPINHTEEGSNFMYEAIGFGLTRGNGPC